MRYRRCRCELLSTGGGGDGGSGGCGASTAPLLLQFLLLLLLLLLLPELGESLRGAGFGSRCDGPDGTAAALAAATA